MPMSFRSPGKISFSFSRKINAARRRHALFHLVTLLHEGDGWMRQAGEVMRCGFHRMQRGHVRLAVVLGGEGAGDMAGADAKLQHHRCGRLASDKFEAFLDRAHDARQIRPRIEQPDRGLHRIGVRAFLNDRATFAIVFADDDHGAAHDARRGEIGQCVGRDIGADNGLPCHRTTDRVIDRGAEHRCGGRFVGAGFDMHAEFGEIILRHRPSHRADATPVRPDSRRHTDTPDCSNALR